jgi:hypothetical protein
MQGGLQLDTPWVYALSGSFNEQALAKLVQSYERAGLINSELLHSVLELAAVRMEAAAVSPRNPEAPLGYKPSELCTLLGGVRLSLAPAAGRRLLMAVVRLLAAYPHATAAWSADELGQLNDALGLLSQAPEQQQQQVGSGSGGGGGEGVIGGVTAVVGDLSGGGLARTHSVTSDQGAGGGSGVQRVTPSGESGGSARFDALFGGVSGGASAAVAGLSHTASGGTLSSAAPLPLNQAVVGRVMGTSASDDAVLQQRPRFTGVAAAQGEVRSSGSVSSAAQAPPMWPTAGCTMAMPPQPRPMQLLGTGRGSMHAPIDFGFQVAAPRSQPRRPAPPAPQPAPAPQQQSMLPQQFYAVQTLPGGGQQLQAVMVGADGALYFPQQQLQQQAPMLQQLGGNPMSWRVVEPPPQQQHQPQQQQQLVLLQYPDGRITTGTMLGPGAGVMAAGTGMLASVTAAPGLVLQPHAPQGTLLPPPPPGMQYAATLDLAGLLGNPQPAHQGPDGGWPSAG